MKFTLPLQEVHSCIAGITLCRCKGAGCEIKNQTNLLEFLIIFFQNMFFPNSYLHVMAVLGLLPTFKKDVRLAFDAHFLDTFSIKKYLILYQLSSVRYQTFFSSYDIKQYVFLSSCLANSCHLDF